MAKAQPSNQPKGADGGAILGVQVAARATG